MVNQQQLFNSSFKNSRRKHKEHVDLQLTERERERERERQRNKQTNKQTHSFGTQEKFQRQNDCINLLGGGFKDFLFSPLFGEDSHFD